jgi:transposase
MVQASEAQPVDRDLERDVDPGCENGMEAGGGAHHWARVLQGKGYRAKLIAAARQSG